MNVVLVLQWTLIMHNKIHYEIVCGLIYYQFEVVLLGIVHNDQ